MCITYLSRDELFFSKIICKSHLKEVAHHRFVKQWLCCFFSFLSNSRENSNNCVVSHVLSSLFTLKLPFEIFRKNRFNNSSNKKEPNRFYATNVMKWHQYCSIYWTMYVYYASLFCYILSFIFSFVENSETFHENASKNIFEIENKKHHHLMYLQSCDLNEIFTQSIACSLVDKRLKLSWPLKNFD